MPVIESALTAERQQAFGTRADLGRDLRLFTRRALLLWRTFLAGLNKLLKLSDFGRGDWLRD